MSISVYQVPEVYEVAFSFRDYKEAVDFIIEATQRAGLSSFHSVVELGCGPGQYCHEFARRDYKAYGLDMSPEMVAYLQQKGKEEKIKCPAIKADFRSFQLPEKVDLAICMMATFEHLLINQDVVEHFQAVADNLVSEGIYLIELSHPKDIFNTDSSVKNQWTLEQNGLKVTTDWGSDSIVDPLTEISDLTVSYKAERDGKVQSYDFRTQTRHYTAGLIKALIELSGRFKIVATYGDLKMEQPFDNSKEAWRMVLVLQKCK